MPKNKKEEKVNIECLFVTKKPKIRHKNKKRWCIYCGWNWFHKIKENCFNGKLLTSKD